MAGHRILAMMSSHDEQPIQPQIVDDDPSTAQGADEETYITEPGRLIRIASMTRAMLEEVREAPLDEAGQLRLVAVYESSFEQLRDNLSKDLQDELTAIFKPLETASTESELRIVQAQLVGWLEGLFSGIQASLFTQQAATAAQLEEIQGRRLEGGEAGQYL